MTRGYEIIKNKVRRSIIDNYDTSELDVIGYEALENDLAKAKDGMPKHFFDSTSKNETAPRIFADICTHQGLVKVMKENAEWVALFEAEGGMLQRLINNKRYDINLLLKGHTLESYSYDTASTQLALERPGLNVLYIVQNEIVSAICGDSRLSGMGFIARFSIYFADATHFQTDDGNYTGGAALDLYRRKILAMLKTNYSQDPLRKIYTCKVDADAARYAKTIEEWSNVQLNAGKFIYMEPFIRKFHGLVIRIAAIIHTWKYDRPEATPIAYRDMHAAGEICSVILNHMDYACKPDGLPAYHTAQKILNWVLRQPFPRTYFTANELNKNIKYKDADDITDGLKLLAKNNILAYIEDPKKSIPCLMHPSFDYAAALFKTSL